MSEEGKVVGTMKAGKVAGVYGEGGISAETFSSMGRV